MSVQDFNYEFAALSCSYIYMTKVQSRGAGYGFYSVVRICGLFLLNAISGQENHRRVSLGVLVDELG